jgi:ABC-type phosphate transport system permease subunit
VLDGKRRWLAARRKKKKKVLERPPEAVNAAAQDYGLSKRQVVTKVDRPSE